jgi:hypothetical protein
MIVMPEAMALGFHPVTHNPHKTQFMVIATISPHYLNMEWNNAVWLDRKPRLRRISLFHQTK